MCCWKVDWKLFLLQAGLDLFCKDQQHPLFCKRTPRRGTRRAPSPSLTCLFSWLCVRHCCCMWALRWHIYRNRFLQLQLRRQIYMIPVSAAAAVCAALLLRWHIYRNRFLQLQLRRHIDLIPVSAVVCSSCILILQFPFQCIPLTEKPYRLGKIFICPITAIEPIETLFPSCDLARSSIYL